LGAHGLTGRLSDAEVDRIKLLAHWMRNAPFLPHKYRVVDETYKENADPDEEGLDAADLKETRESKREEKKETKQVGSRLDRFFVHLDLFIARGRKMPDHRAAHDAKHEQHIQETTDTDGKVAPVLPDKAITEHPFYNIRAPYIGPSAMYSCLSRRVGTVENGTSAWSANRVAEYSMTHI